MYLRFMTFVTLSGAFLAPMCGAIIADYFLLRRQRVVLEDLYRHRGESAYHFHGGVNWAGMAAVATGAIFYLVIYNPVTLTAQPIFGYITASFPAAIIGAVVYYVLARVLYVRRGVGGYAAAPEKVEGRA